MITKNDALALVEQELKGTHKAAHSILAGRIMKGLAPRFNGDPLLWEIVGLCHDIDAKRIGEDISQHGTLAMEMLEGMLPDFALRAIGAHASQTGVKDSSDLALALRAADLVALVDMVVSKEDIRDLLAKGETAYPLLCDKLGDNAGWAEGIRKYAEKNSIPFNDMIAMLL
jgi:predicted hydrolase (HD superfamily)